MSKQRAILALIVLALLTAACGGFGGIPANSIKGSGVVKTETRDVSGGFTAVEIHGSGELVITIGDTAALTIEAEDNILPLLTSDVTEGKLVLSTRPNSSISTTKPMIYRLTVTELQSLAVLDAASATLDSLTTTSFTATVSGAAKLQVGTLAAAEMLNIHVTSAGLVEAESLDSSSVTLTADNSSRISVRALTADTLTATLNGSCAVSMAGTVTTQDITAHSSSNYSAKDLDSQAATVTADGASRVTVSVSGLLNAAAASSAAITYYGTPEVQQTTSESGRIVQG